MNTPLRIVALVMLAAAVIAAQTRSGADLYQEALHLQDVKGDLPAAIAIYKTIVDRHGKDRVLAAKALLQLGACYEKLGRSEARQAYERIVRDYPDVSDVASRAREQLSAIGVADAEPFKVKTLDPVLETASPDGRYEIYFAGATAAATVTDPSKPAHRIMLRDTRDGADRVLLDLDGVITNFAWSPDGRHLAFHLQNALQKVREVRIVTIETGEMRTLPVRDYPVRWSTAGDLYVMRGNTAAYQLEIYKAPAGGGELQKAFSWSLAASETPLNRSFVMPPDVSFIVGSKLKRLLRIDRATGEERRITTGSAEERFPVLSHDGRLVAFASNADGRWGLYVAPLEAIPVANPVRIATINREALGGSRLMRQDSWLPNGTLSVVFDHVGSAIYRVNVDRATGRATGAPRRLTRDGSLSSWGTVSPDGRQIVYWYRDGRVARYGAAVMDADGQNERPLVELDAGYAFWWRGPGEILFTNFAGGQKPEVTVYDIKTLTRKPLAQVSSMQWSYVAARQSILHSSGSRAGAVLRERSLADGTDRDVATLDFPMAPAIASPDGSHIAYSVTVRSDVLDPACEVSLMTFGGRRERVLVPMRRPCSYPVAWSPDGRFLLLNTEMGPGPRILNVETTESWPVHPDAESGAYPAQPRWSASSWSPDGSFVLLTRADRRIERLAWDGVTYDAVVKMMKSSGGGR
jgi:Tol biopolymer transport system component